MIEFVSLVLEHVLDSLVDVLDVLAEEQVHVVLGLLHLNITHDLGQFLLKVLHILLGGDLILSGVDEVHGSGDLLKGVLLGLIALLTGLLVLLTLLLVELLQVIGELLKATRFVDLGVVEDLTGGGTSGKTLGVTFSGGHVHLVRFVTVDQEEGVLADAFVNTTGDAGILTGNRHELVGRVEFVLTKVLQQPLKPQKM